MLIQFLIDSNNYKQYPTDLRGRYKAKLISISYHDDLGSGQHRLLKLSSSAFQNRGLYSGSILFSRDDSPISHMYSEPEVLLECQGYIDFRLETVAGGAIGTTSWCVLTLDVKEFDKE